MVSCLPSSDCPVPLAPVVLFDTSLPAILCFTGGGTRGPLGVAFPSGVVLACLLEIFGVCWNNAFTGGGLGELLFQRRFMSGDTISGLGFLVGLAGVLGGAGSMWVRFFSSPSRFIGLASLSDF